MVSATSNAPGQVPEIALFSATTAPASTDTIDSFAQQLESALESYFGQSGHGSQFDINIQPAQGQESGSGQYLVTITTPSAAATSTTAASAGPVTATTPSAGATTGSAGAGTAADTTSPPTGVMAGTSVPSLSSVMEDFAKGWSVMTPQQVAFQLANASGTGGGDPTATVPGTTLTYGQLNQSQQAAYQYALNYGTGGLSMTDFLTQNAGPQTAWNISYDQAQLIPAIQAAADSSYQVASDGSYGPIQAPQGNGGGDPPASGNLDNLPNPAMIQYLPLDQQAAAEAALAAEGPYGANIGAAADAYATT
jgi:hypothetical protein